MTKTALEIRCKVWGDRVSPFIGYWPLPIMGIYLTPPPPTGCGARTLKDHPSGHSRVSGNPKAVRLYETWIPAFAGMTAGKAHTICSAKLSQVDTHVAYWLLVIRYSLFILGYGRIMCPFIGRTPFFTSNFTSGCEISYPRRYWSKWLTSLTSLTSHTPIPGSLQHATGTHVAGTGAVFRLPLFGLALTGLRRGGPARAHRAHAAAHEPKEPGEAEDRVVLSRAESRAGTSSVVFRK